MSLFRICLPQNFRYQPRSGWPAKGIAIDENFSRRNTLSSKPSHRRFVRKSVDIWLNIGTPELYRARKQAAARKVDRLLTRAIQFRSSSSQVSLALFWFRRRPSPSEIRPWLYQALHHALLMK